MKMFLCLIFLILYLDTVRSIQPFFPSQIVFAFNNYQTVIAIDEINQRAYLEYTFRPTSNTKHLYYAMQHMPFAIPDSPQSNHYVQLLQVRDYPNFPCLFETYWKYGSNAFNAFPSHWLTDKSFAIKNYMNFNFTMIHSTNSSDQIDYWYTNKTCLTTSQDLYPCQEIFFKKGTDIPLQTTEVRFQSGSIIQVKTDYTIISMGKPDDKIFDTIPKNWSYNCQDKDLGVLYHPQQIQIHMNETTNVQVWLASPPHRIDGNDTVNIQWKSTNCDDCFTWTPKEFIFNSKTFRQRQVLTITRIKSSAEQTMLVPIFNGGGFNLVPPGFYPITIL